MLDKISRKYLTEYKIKGIDNRYSTITTITSDYSIFFWKYRNKSSLFYQIF